MTTFPNVAINGVAVSEVQFGPDSSPTIYDSNYTDFDGDGSSVTDEFIALTNFSDTAVDISGYTLYNSSLSLNTAFIGHATYHTFSGGTVLQPGETIYVVTEYTGTPPAGVLEANGGDTSATDAVFTNSQISDTETGSSGATGLSGNNTITLQGADKTYVHYDFSQGVTNYDNMYNNATAAAAAAPPGSTPAQKIGELLGANEIDINNASDRVNTDYTFHYDANTGNMWTSREISTLADTSADAQTQLDLNGLTFTSAFNNLGTGSTAYTDLFDIDGDGNTASNDFIQFIEIRNVTGSAISLDGYSVYGQIFNSGNMAALYTFGAGDSLGVGETIRIYNRNYTGSPPDGVIATNTGSANNFWANNTSNGGNYLLVDSTGNALAFETNGGDTTYNIPSGVTVLNTIDATDDASVIKNSDQIVYDWLTGATGVIYDSVTPQSFMICFGGETQIATARGEKRAIDIQVGDRVLTTDNGFQTVRWVGRRSLNAADLRQNPNLRPIRIKAGAFGQELPKRDLLVSQQHRVLVSSDLAKEMTGEKEVLLAAKTLRHLCKVQMAKDVEQIVYVHFLFDRHEIVFAEGLRAESLYTGPQALKSLSRASRKEILQLFPELETQNTQSSRPTARAVVRGRVAVNLIQSLSSHIRA